MTQHNPHVHRNSAAAVREQAPRLRLKSNSSKTGYVDGAWWPRSDDLAIELPALLTAVSRRLGPVRRVTYRLGEWASTPEEMVVEGTTVVLEGHRNGTVNTIELLGTRDRRLVVLVIPPYTDDHRAFAAMTTASAGSDVSTVDELLMITPRERHNRAERAEAVHRWKSDDQHRTSTR